MSLGGTLQDSSIFDSFFYDLETAGTEVLFVAAAGNDGNDSYLYPASVDSRLMMSVACVKSDSVHCSFSQYNDQVDIAAPGNDVFSTIPNGGYGNKSGTSMSSPHVAAVAALIWSHHPTATVADIRGALEISAIQPDPYSQGVRNDYLGWGIVNARLALEALVPASLSPSPTLNPTVYQPSGEPSPSPILNPTMCDEDPEVTIGRKKPDGTIVERTCGWLGKKSDITIRNWCKETEWPDDTIPPASYACPNTCDTCSAAPSSAPTSVCHDSASEKFFFKFDEDSGIALGRRCSKFHGKNEEWIQRICNITPPAGSEYLSAKDICPETCDNCCAIENEHLENKVAVIENENEELVNKVERYEDLLNFHNITFSL